MNASYAQIAGAFTSLAFITTTIAIIGPTLKMAKPIMEAEPEIAEGKQVITNLNGGIELSNVSFRYDDLIAKNGLFAKLVERQRSDID